MSENPVARKNSTSSASTSLHAFDVVSSVAWALLVALSVAMSTGDLFWLGGDISGFLLLVIALTYRGSSLTWWSIHAPVALVLLFAPVARWEVAGALSTGGLMRAALVPGLSFIGACLIATVRETLVRSIEGAGQLRELRNRTFQKIREVKDMEIEMKEILNSLAKAPIAPAKPIKEATGDVAWQTIEFSGEGAMSAHLESDAMSYFDVQSLLANETERASKLAPQARLFLSSPTELSIPLAVRGEIETSTTVIRGLIEGALDSLVGTGGVIRITLRPGLRALEISIEDNGRGLNEALILKLEAKGLMSRADSRLSWSDLKVLSTSSGWTLDLQARLGVGSRVTLSLPRVDAFAYGARIQHTREMRGSINSLNELDSGSQPG